MTTYDLDTLTLANIGEEDTNENRQAYSPQFLVAYYEAYATLCNNILKPVAALMVQLDDEKRFDIAVFDGRLAPGGIKSVKAHRDFTAETGYAPAHEYAFHWVEDGRAVVPAAPAGAEVYVTYFLKPDALVIASPTISGSGSEPVLMPLQYHGALSSYAAASFFRMRRKFERMQVWMETWLSAVRDMQGKADGDSLKIRNVYTPMA